MRIWSQSGQVRAYGPPCRSFTDHVARNLKFYPLSLFLTIRDGSLKFLRNSVGLLPPFEIELCNGQTKSFMDCTSWELLNLKPTTVLNIPQALSDVYGISQTALAAAMKEYSIQTKGKDYLEKEFKIDKLAEFFVGTTKHYSWPKGAGEHTAVRNCTIG